MKTFALLISISLLLASMAHAQGESEAERAPGADALYELGLHVGNLLPNQIEGVTEIIGLGGARGAFRLAPMSYAEFGFITGNGEGVEWKNAHIDVRMDIPVETLIAVAFVGADAIMYEGNGVGGQVNFGGHAGGGIQSHLTGMTWFRADMKFGFSPGTSLYIGMGLVFRMGSGGAGS